MNHRRVLIVSLAVLLSAVSAAAQAPPPRQAVGSVEMPLTGRLTGFGGIRAEIGGRIAGGTLTVVYPTVGVRVGF